MHVKTSVCANAGEIAMRLTNFSDYALRVLMYAAAREDRLITIDETAKVYGISRAHLMKVVNQLTRAGYLKAVRGRSGGLALGKRPNKIRLGDVLRTTEPDFALVECLELDNQCVITARCRLRGALKEALGAFIGTLDRYTLADLILNPRDFGVRPAARLDSVNMR
jgi:Rrf2 family transcriptional regulator, nitric oxide-sensitive transcriptional repressor